MQHFSHRSHKMPKIIICYKNSTLKVPNTPPRLVSSRQTDRKKEIFEEY